MDRFWPVSWMRRIRFLPFLLLFLLTGCAPAPPDHTNNVCRIFQEYPSWYWQAKKAQTRWGMPVSVQMAIMYQESSFNGTIKPPRTKILWVIPWTRPTSAYGYSQALDQTWNNYEASAGNSWADRDDFDDASDFVSWYGHQAHRKLGISMSNAYAQYLAYHEGIGGYARGSYRKKSWLVQVAHKVQHRAIIYDRQLKSCEDHIPKSLWMRLTGY